MYPTKRYTASINHSNLSKNVPAYSPPEKPTLKKLTLLNLALFALGEPNRFAKTDFNEILLQCRILLKIC